MLRQLVERMSYPASRLALARAYEIETFGPVIAALRQRVLGFWRRIEQEPPSVTAKRPFGIVGRIHKALEPKPLFSTKREMCWSRYIAAEKLVERKHLPVAAE